MTYLNYINSTVSNENGIKWNYYGNYIPTNDILSASVADEFINRYFDNGGKKYSLIIDPENSNLLISEYFTDVRRKFVSHRRSEEMYKLPPERTVHTVSGFFLGLLIENCLSGTTPIFLDDSDPFLFSYLWFLTFLYHDYGYCVTEGENCFVQYSRRAPTPETCPENCKFHEYIPLQTINKKLDIIFSPFRQFTHSRPHVRAPQDSEISMSDLVAKLVQPDNAASDHTELRFSNGSIINGPQYPKLTVARYLNYCINTRQRVDHGIVGGYLFYDRMVKNYLLAYIGSTNDFSVEQDIKKFSYNGLKFHKEQLAVFSYIADCILSHNIFKQPTNMKALYEEYRLTPLLKENFKNISFESNPLLYILAISDTLEPIKIYRQHDANLSAQVIAEAINIEYAPGTHKLRFSSNSGAVNIRLLHQKAKELTDWTSATCTNIRNGSFTLKI